MNELIRKLNEQAQDWADAHAPYASEEHEYFAEKFAQLIVLECVQTLIDNTPERYTNESAEEDWDKGYDRAMKDCVHHIKEHFGVK